MPERDGDLDRWPLAGCSGGILAAEFRGRDAPGTAAGMAAVHAQVRNDFGGIASVQ